MTSPNHHSAQPDPLDAALSAWLGAWDAAVADLKARHDAHKARLNAFEVRKLLEAKP